MSSGMPCIMQLEYRLRTLKSVVRLILEDKQTITGVKCMNRNNHSISYVMKWKAGQSSAGVVRLSAASHPAYPGCCSR